MKKILCFLSILALTVCLFSCETLPGGNGGGSTGEAVTVWSPEVKVTIVSDTESPASNSLYNHIYDLTNYQPEAVTSSASVVSHEIVFGETERAISKTAYERFERFADINELNDLGHSAYLIYVEGDSLAVAYSDIYAKDAAINYIIANYNSDTLALDEGVAVRQEFNTQDFINNYRNEQREAGFKELEKILGAAAVQEIRELYDLYDEDLYLWAANLYDPDIGGFYYSNSARNNVGFLPDIESTVQMMHLIVNSGLAHEWDDKWYEMLPDDVLAKMGEFAYSLQDADGYFYHPQWGKSISTTRRGRDLGWAVQVLSALEITPKYDTANGVLKGENSDATATSAKLTGRLGLSATIAASKVVATASENAELSSPEAFRAYLEGLSWTNSYSTGNLLNSRSGEIAAAGYTDIVREYLTEIQNPENGLWEDTVTIQSINGLMKISGFFGSSFPNADKALESTLTIMSLPITEELDGVTYVYNPWVILGQILDATDDEFKEEYLATLHRRAAELIDNTCTKLAIFAKEDGGFSYSIETSAAFSQGALAAVEGSRESDVNATGIGISTSFKYMFEVLELDVPRLYYEYDAYMFLDTLEGLGSIVKDTAGVAEPEVVNFREYDPEIGEEEYGVVKHPHDTIETIIGDTELVGELYKWLRVAIVDDPAGSGEKVLYGTAYTDPAGTKVNGSSNSSIEIDIVNHSIAGNCYIFESDIYCGTEATSTSASTIITLDFASQNIPYSGDQSSRYDLKLYKGSDGNSYLKLTESQWYCGSNGKGTTDTETLIDKIPVKKWFKLRLELYKVLDENGTGLKDMYIKVYLDDTFVTECITGRYTGNNYYIDHVVDCIRFCYYRYSYGEFYLNNIYAAKTSDVYAPEAE